MNLQLRREIVRLHAEFGFGLLYGTHRGDEAAEIATRVVQIDQDRIAAPAKVSPVSEIPEEH